MSEYSLMPHLTQYRSFWRHNHPREATQDAERRPQTLEFHGICRTVKKHNRCLRHLELMHPTVSQPYLSLAKFQNHKTEDILVLQYSCPASVVLALTSLLTLWCICCCMVLVLSFYPNFFSNFLFSVTYFSVVLRIMHPRNRYRDCRPDFKLLADKYAEFRKHTTTDSKGRVRTCSVVFWLLNVLIYCKVTAYL